MQTASNGSLWPSWPHSQIPSTCGRQSFGVRTQVGLCPLHRAGCDFGPPTVARAAHFSVAPRARFFRIVAGHSPPSGSGTYQRVRGRGLHRSRSKRSCSELAGISRRSRRRKVVASALDAQKKQFPPHPPLPDPTTKCPRDCIANVVNISISVVRWHDAAPKTGSDFLEAPPPGFVCALMKSASR
jgi:hypothetical protein